MEVQNISKSNDFALIESNIKNERTTRIYNLRWVFLAIQMSFRSLVISVVIFVGLIQSIESGPFEDIGCKGELDSVGWAKLDRIVEDCFSLMRSVELYGLSR